MLTGVSQRQALLAAGMIVLLLVTVAVYWSGLSGPFMLDDSPNIVAGFIRASGWDEFVYAITHNGSGMLGRGVSMASFVLTGLQYGLDPWGYKYHNLLLHLLNGLMLFRLLQLALPLMDRKLEENRAARRLSPRSGCSTPCLSAQFSMPCSAWRNSQLYSPCCPCSPT